MKFKAFALLTVIALAVALLGAASPVAAAAYGTSFVTSITYMNVGSGPATITLTFYAEGSSSPITIPLAQLPVNAGASINVGSTSVAAGFKGSAVMSSDQPLAATMVQLPPSGSPIKNRPLSNGFSGGAAYVLIPTALKNTFATNSVISIQNVDSVGADVTVNFVPVSGAAIPLPKITNLPSGASKYYDLGSLAAIGSSFNGSVQITSVRTGTATAGAVVATSLEASTANNNVYAFEGIATTSDTIYMPSAFCNYSGGISSAYAIQNTSTTTATSIKVTYSNGNSETKTGIGAGAKVSLSGCSAGNPNGFIGSAVVTTVPAGGTIVGIAKITGNGLSTAFVGVGDGASKLYAPYVRYTEAHWSDGTKQRAFIAIQNVGGAQLAAGAVSIKYYDKDGNQVGATITNLAVLPVGGKFSSSAHDLGAAGNEFGYIGTTFGGSAVITGPTGSKLAVVVRVQTSTGGTSSVGEDYNGIP